MLIISVRNLHHLLHLILDLLHIRLHHQVVLPLFVRIALVVECRIVCGVKGLVSDLEVCLRKIVHAIVVRGREECGVGIAVAGELLEINKVSPYL